MPVSSVNFTNDKSPTDKVSSILDTMDSSDAEVVFGDGKVDRAYIEMIVSEYAEKAQNPAMANKWIQIDTALEKELRKFKVATKNLLQMIQNAPVPEPEQQQAPQQQAQQGNAPTQQGPAEARKLPEPLV